MRLKKEPVGPSDRPSHCSSGGGKRDLLQRPYEKCSARVDRSPPLPYGITLKTHEAANSAAGDEKFLRSLQYLDRPAGRSRTRYARKLGCVAESRRSRKRQRCGA